MNGICKIIHPSTKKLIATEFRILIVGYLMTEKTLHTEKISLDIGRLTYYICLYMDNLDMVMDGSECLVS